MSYGADYYAERNPAGQYGAGDLAIAYLENEDGYVIARTLVWPDKKIYARIYGDEDENLAIALASQGYLYDSLGFTGARLLKEWGEGEFEDEYCEGWLCPYLDVAYGSFRVEDDYLIIDPSGAWSVGTSGIAYEQDSPDRGSVYLHRVGLVKISKAIRTGQVCCISHACHQLSTG